MLRHKRDELIEEIWSNRQDPGRINIFDSIETLECWDYDGISTIHDGENYRRLTLPGDEGRPIGDAEQNLDNWLSQRGIYTAPKPPQNAGQLRGGLRILLCDRPGAGLSMNLSEYAFRAIEKAFDLHDSTLPSFSSTNGSFAAFFSKSPTTCSTEKIHIVAKAHQKTEITNCLLSLTYDAEKHWTNAFICGDGVTKFRERYDFVYGHQKRQLIAAILSDPQYWSNPLLTPCSLLQMWTGRLKTRISVIDNTVIDLESHLGVTFAVGADLPLKLDEWPENIDVKTMTIKLHSVLHQILIMRNVCLWLCNYGTFLIELETRLSKDSVIAQHRPYFGEIGDTLALLRSTVENVSNGFNEIRDRTNSQINLLFSVISQKDSLISQKGNAVNLAIAESTKQDSISMSTFTFITAFFLPGTYIASLFSMTMFNWQVGDSVSSNGSAGYISRKFWLYWAATVPLTLITLAGWYVWFIYDNKAWRKSLSRISQSTSSL